MTQSIRAARRESVVVVETARAAALDRAQAALEPLKDRLSEAHAKTKDELVKAGASQD
jgi:hypothetical protein